MIGERPIPGDNAFWDYALGDSCFAAWIRLVDDMCMRFLDQDLLSMPIVNEQPGLDLRDCFDAGIRPGAYFAELLEHMKEESGDDLITSHVAFQAKWGNVIHDFD